MADRPKIAPDDATRTRPVRWPEASAAVPTGLGDGPRTGDRVGRYRVEKRLGAGGMGVVVLARDPELSRQVALKVVRPGIGDRAYRDRLVREARAMAQLDHPNVVRVHDAGVADGEVFVAMEYVPGQTLGAWMKAAPRPWREVVRRFVQAGRGLAAAHAAGLVHRDFKPDNVLVRESDGRVAVSDFGLAAPVREYEDGDPLTTIPDRPRADAAPAEATIAPVDDSGFTPVSGDDSTVAAPRSGVDGATPVGAVDEASPLGAAGLTVTGAVIGTPAYMAPEQAGGNATDARADIYSFCVALHEGVYGKRPFTVTPLPGGGYARGPVSATLDERGAPAALLRLLQRGLATDPSDRWATMAPLVDALERLLGRRRRHLAIATALLATAALGLGAFALVARQPSDTCADRAAQIAWAWGPPQRDATRAALLASHLPYAPQAAAAALDSLDQWARSWHDVRLDACRAAERGVMPEAEARTRAECLDRLLTTSIARIGILQTSSPEIVQRALEIASLPEATTCTVGQVEPPPPDAATQAAIASMRDELAAIDLQIARNRNREALDGLRRLAPRAEQVGFAPLVDEIAHRMINEEIATGAMSAETASRARQLAERFADRGHDAVVAALWFDVVTVKIAVGAFDGLDETASAARVAARRTHDLKRELRTEVAIGELTHAAGRTDEGRAICASAVARSTGMHGNLRAHALNCMHAIEDDARGPEALSFAIASFEETVANSGPGHPETIDSLANLATAYEHRDLSRAALQLRIVCASIIASQRGMDSPDHASSLLHLSFSYLAIGDLAQTRATLAQSTRGMAQLPDTDARKLAFRTKRAYLLNALGDTAAAIDESLALARAFEQTKARSATRAFTVMNLAGQLAELDRCPEALPIADRAIEDLRDGITPTVMLFLESTRAYCRALTGAAAVGLRDLDAAWRRVDPAQLAPSERGMVEMVMATVLDKSGADRARTLDTALRARKDLEGAASPADLAKLDRLIARLRR